MYLQSADNSMVELRLKSDSVNRRVVASDASNAVKSQVIFGDGEIQLASANVGSALFATFNVNGLVLSGSAGIGTSSPEVKLHVQTNEPGFPTSFMVDNQGSDFAGFKVRSTGGDIDLNNSGGNTCRINVVDGDCRELEL